MGSHEVPIGDLPLRYTPHSLALFGVKWDKALKGRTQFMKKRIPGRHLARTWKWSLLLGLLLFLGCAPAPSLPLASPIPYATRTPTFPPPTMALPTPSRPPPPLPSPTPSSYTIRSGDTLEGLAKRFNLTVDDLIKANPGLTSLLQPGQVIFIPAPRAEPAPATPTPLPLLVAPPVCYPRPDPTRICFFVLENPSAGTLENVALQVAFGARDDLSRTRRLFLPLDILPPHSRLPAFDTFPASEEDETFDVYVVSALGLSPEDSRYLPATLHRVQIVVAPSGRFARVSGDVYLPPQSGVANLIWIAATAYDALDRAVGFTRWEANAPLAAGERLPFAFSLGSFAPIEQVELLVEARR